MGLVNDTYFVDSNNKLNFVYTVAAAGTYDRSMAVDEIKDVQINNNKIHLLSEYIAKIPVVVFSPGDLRILKDSKVVKAVKQGKNVTSSL